METSIVLLNNPWVNKNENMRVNFGDTANEIPRGKFIALSV